MTRDGLINVFKIPCTHACCMYTLASELTCEFQVSMSSFERFFQLGSTSVAAVIRRNSSLAMNASTVLIKLGIINIPLHRVKFIDGERQEELLGDYILTDSEQGPGSQSNPISLSLTGVRFFRLLDRKAAVIVDEASSLESSLVSVAATFGLTHFSCYKLRYFEINGSVPLLLSTLFNSILSGVDPDLPILVYHFDILRFRYGSRERSFNIRDCISLVDLVELVIKEFRLTDKPFEHIFYVMPNGAVVCYDDDAVLEYIAQADQTTSGIIVEPMIKKILVCDEEGIPLFYSKTFLTDEGVCKYRLCKCSELGITLSNESVEMLVDLIDGERYVRTDDTQLTSTKNNEACIMEFEIGRAIQNYAEKHGTTLEMIPRVWSSSEGRKSQEWDAAFIDRATNAVFLAEAKHVAREKHFAEVQAKLPGFFATFPREVP